MNWLYWGLIGLIAGAVAGRIVRGSGFGCLGNIVVGVIGSLVGGWLFNLLQIATPFGFWGSLLTATVGAIAFLAALNLVFDRD